MQARITYPQEYLLKLHFSFRTFSKFKYATLFTFCVLIAKHDNQTLVIKKYFVTTLKDFFQQLRQASKEFVRLK